MSADFISIKVARTKLGTFDPNNQQVNIDGSEEWLATLAAIIQLDIILLAGNCAANSVLRASLSTRAHAIQDDDDE